MKLVQFIKTITHILYSRIVSEFKPTMGIVHFGAHNTGSPRILSFNHNTRVVTGNFVQFAENVAIIGAGGEHPISTVSNFTLRAYFLKLRSEESREQAKANTVAVGNDVWIGTGATIFHGVSIGNGAVVGAGSVVTKDIPPFAIVAGSPAKILRYRFSEEQIRELEAIAWWNWSTSKIVANIPLFQDVDLFIARFRNDPRNNRNVRT